MTKFKEGDKVKIKDNAGFSAGATGVVTSVSYEQVTPGCYEIWVKRTHSNSVMYFYEHELELIEEDNPMSNSKAVEASPRQFEVGKKYQSNLTGVVATCIAINSKNLPVIDYNNHQGENFTYILPEYNFQYWTEYHEPVKHSTWQNIYEKETNASRSVGPVLRSREDCDLDHFSNRIGVLRRDYEDNKFVRVVLEAP